MDCPGQDRDPASPSGPEADARAGPFELRLSLSGMDPEDDLRVMLPPGHAGLPIARVLELVFPADPESGDGETLLDVRGNPDLPEIYAVFLDAFKGWRKGLWDLSVSSEDSVGLELTDWACLYLRRLGGACGGEHCPCLHLRVDQQYDALEYAVRQGFWPRKAELLEWLREMTALFYLDKFEQPLASAPLGCEGVPGVAGLQSQGLIAPSEDGGPFVITQEGRAVIGRLLSETEGYIELYDHFKDADFDEEAEDVRFGRGRGVDLRAQVYETEGLDPIRTVFLLRLYDGSLDPFADSWTGITDEGGLFAELLEPVVNRFYVDDDLIGRIIDSGYSYLQESHEEARRLASESDLVRRVRRYSP